jgi:hypothetical protein
LIINSGPNVNQWDSGSATAWLSGYIPDCGAFPADARSG